MTENKMPERIWTDEECATKWLVTPTKGDTAYIRADLVEPLVEALRGTIAKFDACADSAVRNTPLGINKCRAALSSWEAAQSGQAQTEPHHDES